MTLIYILGIALRIVWINIPPLWYDENFTLILARLPLDQMLKATAGDVHPPLWYLVEWGIYHITPDLLRLSNAWIIRLPALVFSIASLYLFDAIMLKLQVSSQVRKAALFLMAVLPFQLWYAQEGRMYAMLEFFVLLTLFAALHKNYVLVFIGSLAMLYTQNYGPFYMAAILLVVVAQEKFWILFNRESASRINWTTAAMVSAGVLWLPWMNVIRKQMSGISGSYWIMDKSLGSIVVNLYKLFFTAAVPETFFFASYAVTFVALIAGSFALARSAHAERVTVAIMAFVPLVIAMLVSWLWQPVILFRPLIGISPFLYLVTCWSLEERNAI